MKSEDPVSITVDTLTDCAGCSVVEMTGPIELAVTSVDEYCKFDVDSESPVELDM